MTREEVKELLPIVKAFAEGRTIQLFGRDGWTDLDKNFIFDINYRYRIKPETKYRPFANEEECWRVMLKHQPFGWVKDGSRMCNVINIREDGVIAHNGVGNSWYDFERSFKLTFADGTPFGIKDE